jgi:hypothetical protein
MSLTSRVGAALFALTLSACAHQASSIGATPSYSGGRAAQPGGWMAESQHAATQQAPHMVRDGDSYLGGRASNADAWLANETPRQAKVAATSCKSAGRAAQPFSGQSQQLVTAPSDRGAKVACRTARAEHF